MLNPPLSNLSDDLISYIIYQVSKLPFGYEYLYNLSLADRAFTKFCQERLFRTLELTGETCTAMSFYIERTITSWRSDPAISAKVCQVCLSFIHGHVSWLLGHHNFINIFDALAASPMPPNELHLEGLYLQNGRKNDARLVEEWFNQYFFRQSLTVLHLTSCENVPLTLLRHCPRLREVSVNDIEVIEQITDDSVMKGDSNDHLPSLEYLDFRHAHAVIKQLVFPPYPISKGVISWSSLRVLTLSPHEKEEMQYLQRIVDFSRDTLEELYLDKVKYTEEKKHLFLAELVDLKGLRRLRVCVLFIVINCEADDTEILHDTSLVLGTIPSHNSIENISFDFYTIGTHPFSQALNQSWDNLCNEIIRISSKNGIELELYMTVVSQGRSILTDYPVGWNLLLEQVKEVMTSTLMSLPSICTHFWDRAYWTCGFGQYTGGKVRPKCRR